MQRGNYCTSKLKKVEEDLGGKKDSESRSGLVSSETFSPFLFYHIFVVVIQHPTNPLRRNLASCPTPLTQSAISKFSVELHTYM